MRTSAIAIGSFAITGVELESGDYAVSCDELLELFAGEESGYFADRDAIAGILKTFPIQEREGIDLLPLTQCAKFVAVLAPTNSKAAQFIDSLLKEVIQKGFVQSTLLGT